MYLESMNRMIKKKRNRQENMFIIFKVNIWLRKWNVKISLILMYKF